MSTYTLEPGPSSVVLDVAVLDMEPGNEYAVLRWDSGINGYAPLAEYRGVPCRWQYRERSRALRHAHRRDGYLWVSADRTLYRVARVAHD